MASDNGDMFKGFLLGGMLGDALGLLFAPKSGKDIRADLKGEGDELYDKAKDELEKIKTDLGDLRDKITETIDRGKSLFEDQASTEEDDFEAELNSEVEEPVEEKPKRKPRRKTTKTEEA